MYFKQIYLHGFKSFADPTTVTLDLGTTAIVGPNGCGKSNILDALRWGLGEQSAKTLRGSHMQDVIFSGSIGRPATGMAEVTLVFDNADGKLPLEYAEIEVTRRVYRNGDSEYLLNKSLCRLKDIQELFMDTGIGTNAYSLIGQGKIDLVLSSKPEDRRYLLEEAAGIIKYKTRKRVAMRKLESAEQNMLRLADIIAEVDRQMRTLKRQVNAAIRHRELTEQVRLLEIRNSWLQYNELSGQITDLKAQLSEATDHYHELAAKTSRQEAELEAITLKRHEASRALSECREKEYSLDSEMERLENQITLYRKEIEFITTRSVEAQAEAERLTLESTNLKNRSGSVSQELLEHTTKIQTLKQALEKSTKELENATKALQDTEIMIEALHERRVEAINVRNKAHTEIETVNTRITDIHKQRNTVEESIVVQKKRHQEARTVLEQFSEKAKVLQSNLTDIVTKKTESQTLQRNLNQEHARINQEWQSLREKISSEEGRLKSLIELRDSYEGFAVGVRAVMMGKQREFKGLSGIIGPAGDLVSTEKQYRFALEAALGGNINNVVVRLADDAKSAIEFLKENRAGRVTFLPLDTIRPARNEDAASFDNMKGVVGALIQFVECDAEVLPAIQYLLYNTLLVETIDDAIRISRSEKHHPRLVTLEGEVVTSAGTVTGGRTKTDSHGLLGRSAEIEELEESTRQRKKQIKKLEEQGLRIAAKIQDLSDALKSIEASENDIRKTAGAHEVALARHATEEANLSAMLDSLEKQKENLNAQEKDLAERLQAARSNIAGMDGDDQAIQGNFEETQQLALVQKEELAALAKLNTEQRVELAETIKSYEELQRDLDRSSRGGDEMLEKANLHHQQIEAFKKQISDLELKINNTITQSKALSEKRDHAHEAVLVKNKDLQFLQESTDKLTIQVKENREKENIQQKKVHKLELDCSQKEERVRSFVERIATEYNLVLSSLTEKEVGVDEYDEQEREARIQESRNALQRLGNVNLAAIDEYESLEKREAFLKSQNDDLIKAKETLLGVVKRIDQTTEEMFLQTFKQISENFQHYFRRLFNGGQARLFLLDDNTPLDCGIEIEARPPGKKPQTISLLSGGEQALTAIALLFSIFAAKPSPFCVLDEVDAPLDDVNVGRFLNIVNEFTEHSQFIMITHNKQTMAHANAIFGVTQQEAGVSQLVSVHLEEAEKVAGVS
ncbi:MAG TPA: chromosome segregation protein SMC [Candidatus Hydrogenedentes bacterium]|nr:chromosome segregation protein SMC [Candidatus Hydrogenedentota bacterium]HOD94683.1 chromosome segregation protein SMC [Candidatus Hydrogenedentota bacterium]HOR50192.1 chromosome segregation protein SMC [Candidatus Hydrogenedentota bacterium]HPK24465.1 chromosome segregation protein SMC [Candidatus Hydrogenedentota bacterium]